MASTVSIPLLRLSPEILSSTLASNVMIEPPTRSSPSRMPFSVSRALGILKKPKSRPFQAVKHSKAMSKIIAVNEMTVFFIFWLASFFAQRPLYNTLSPVVKRNLAKIRFLMAKPPRKTHPAPSSGGPPVVQDQKNVRKTGRLGVCKAGCFVVHFIHLRICAHPIEVTLLKIGIPRAFLYYRYHTLWETFLEELGVDFIVSPPTNKAILNAGSICAIDEACLPMKIFLGHVDWLIGRCDKIQHGPPGFGLYAFSGGLRRGRQHLPRPRYRAARLRH